MSDHPDYERALRLALALAPAERLRLIAELSAGLSAELSAEAAQTPEPPEPAPGPAVALEPADGPIRLVRRPDDPRSPLLIANGLDVETGRPLLTVDAAALKEIAARPEGVQREESYWLTKGRRDSSQPHLGMVYGKSYRRLADAGWAVVVHEREDAAILRELWPLVAHRCAEQALALPAVTFRDGETCGEWLVRHGADPKRPWHPALAKVRLPVFLYQTGTPCRQWLANLGVSAGAVSPERGVPFYLLIAGRPAPDAPGGPAVPYSFQYDLDIFWGVGRVCFTRPDGSHDLTAYRAYAEQVVQFEGRPSPPYGRHIVFAATRHRFDSSTEASEEELVLPLAQGLPDEGVAPVGQAEGFTRRLLRGLEATRDALGAVLTGADPAGRPAILFTATHGAGLRPEDPRLSGHQGALVCADWDGTGSVRREHWLAAEDLPERLAVEGLVAVTFACYGVGCPSSDQYAAATGRRRQIAPRDLVAALPQRLLAAGALAVIGHVDRAWSYSFSEPELGVRAQSQAFEDVLRRLMDGGRVGFATDQFNLRQATYAHDLGKLVESARFVQSNPDFGLDRIGPLWRSYQDARSYAVLGDPAVRLPYEPSSPDRP